MSQDGDHGRSLEYEYHVGVFAARKEKKVTSKKRYKYTRGQKWWGPSGNVNRNILVCYIGNKNRCVIMLVERIRNNSME